MTNSIHIDIIVFCTIALTLLSNASFGQAGMPYDGIDSTRGIGWRISSGFSRTDSQWRILKEYDLVQSDYLVVANCYDSSIVYLQPWKIPKNCLRYFAENRDRVERDTLNKYVQICWQAYYNDLSNAAVRDTVFIDPDNSAIMLEDRTEEELFFLTKEKHFSPNSTDSIVMEFYTLNEVKNECINDFYFRRKSLKMYSNGKPEGIWIDYNRQGKKIRKTEYENGVILTDETF